VRRLVVPTLAKALNPAAARHLVEAAGRLREDAAYLDALARERFEAIARASADVLPAGAGARRASRIRSPRASPPRARRAGCDPRRISSRTIDAVVALARRRPARPSILPGRIGARRRARLLEFGPCASPAKS
jgi:hypothetical protein